jgi:hypothetical protein
MPEAARPKIFISHSAKTDPAKRLLDRLQRELDDAGFELLVDHTRLDPHPGVRWREALNAWLEICDGAIILCSREALQSDWVKAEAAILNHRWVRGEGRFKLLLGLVGDVTPEDLEHGFWRVTGLSIPQVVRSTHQETLPERAAALFDPLKERYQDTPAMRRERDLLAYLEPCNESELAAAARRLGADLAYWAPEIEGKRKSLARLLLQATLTDAAEALEQIPRAKLPDPIKVLELIEPSWVSLVGVDWLCEKAVRSAVPCAVALNTGKEHTVRCYVRRASLVAGKRWKTLDLPYRQGEEAEAEFANELDGEVRRVLSADPTAAPAELGKGIARLRTKQRLATLLIRRRHPRLREEIEAVHRRYREIIVLVLIEDDPWEELVAPPIDPESERQYLSDRADAWAIVGPDH